RSSRGGVSQQDSRRRRHAATDGARGGGLPRGAQDPSRIARRPGAGVSRRAAPRSLAAIARVQDRPGPLRGRHPRGGWRRGRGRGEPGPARRGRPPGPGPALDRAVSRRAILAPGGLPALALATLLALPVCALAACGTGAPPLAAPDGAAPGSAPKSAPPAPAPDGG